MGRARRDVTPYVPRVASDWDHPNPRWRELDGTLVFVDISGFTNLSERLTRFGRIGGEELVDVLNRVFRSMLDLAYERGGTLLKFGGDALLLLFTGEGHPAQAAAAAVEMRAALRAANQEPTSVGRLHLRLSVGVHSGGVHLFRVGSSHTELLVAGPAASTTALMEHTAVAGEIVVSWATRAALPPGSADVPRGDGWLLGWRRPRVEPVGAKPRAKKQRAERFVPPSLLEHLQAARPDGEHRTASAAFISMRGTDTIIAEEGPEAAWEALNEVVTTIAAAVDAEGITFLATDLDTDGAKVLLAAGAPRSLEDDEGRMLRVARAIVSAPSRLSVRIGINHGHVFTGDVGTEYRATYAVMGDVVNLAARLMSAAEPGQVLVTAPVLEGSRTAFAAVPLPPLMVKGKSKPVEAYAVGEEIGEREVEREGELPWRGRAEELAALRDAVSGADPQPLVCVVGPAGIGKTRIVDEALADEGVARFDVRGEPYAVTGAYRALRYPLRRLLDIEAVPPGERPAAMVRAVTRLDPTVVPWLPLVGDIAHVKVAPTPEVDALDPRFRRQRAAEVVYQLLAATWPGALRIVIDDAQWIDEASADLLTALVVGGEGRGWATIATRRDEPGGFDPEDVPTIRLRPLDPADAKAAVVAATAAAPMHPDALATIVDRAGGNPLYLGELVNAVRATGIDDLPSSLDATIAAQIDRLPHAVRRAIRLAAVLGRTFPREVFDEVLAGEDLSLSPSMRRQLDTFLEPDGVIDVRFRHALLQEVAYDELPYRRRREVHKAAAEAIERINADDPTRAADVLGLHYSRAGEHAAAWHYAHLAGQTAARAHAHAAAAAHFERALAAAAKAPVTDDTSRAVVWVQLGDSREQTGAFDLALDAYRRAAGLLAGDVLGEAELALKRARARERTGSYRLALRELSNGLRRLDAIDDVQAAEAASLRASLLAFRAVVRQGQGQMADALSAAETAADAAHRAGNHRALANAYAVMDWVHLATGRLTEVRNGEEARRLYEGLGDLEGQGRVLNTMGAAAFYRGDWDEAMACYRQAQAIGERTGNHVQAAVSGMNIGEILVNQGSHDEAEALLDDAIRVFQASGYPDGRALATIYLGRSRLGRGDLDGAEAALVAAREEFAAVGVPGGVLEATVHLADVAVQRDEPDHALALLDTALAGVHGDAGVLASAVARVRAAALLTAGRPDEALEQRIEGLAAARAHQLPYEERLLLELDCVVDLRDDAVAPT